MRKIAFYIDCMGLGGANRVMANLVSYFHDAGYEVCLINDIQLTGEDEEYILPDGISRYFIDNDCKHHNFLCKQLHRLKAIRDIIRANEAEVIVSFMGPPNIRMLMATLGMDVKRVVSVRNDPYREYGHGLKKALAGAIFTLADGCVFQTEEAMSYFPPSVRKKARVILNPVKEIFYQTERSEAVSDIVSVGRLFPQKNHELLIKSFAKVAEIYPNENLYIYGEGPLRKELQDLIEELNLQNRVFLPGSTTNVNEKLCKAKLFVLSSDYEGMPNGLMEAMACGVPVISTDCPCGGPRTLLGDNEYGLLTPCNSIEKLAEAIAIMLSDDCYDNYSHKARERSAIFEPELIFKQWEEYLFAEEDGRYEIDFT